MTNTYTIPVVIHLYHNNGPENISDIEIFTIMERVNELYGSNTPNNDTKVRFKLAKLDPVGNCTNGIHRVQINNPDHQVGLVWYEGYNWDQEKYINIHLFRGFNDVNGVSEDGTKGYAASVPVYGGKIVGNVLINLKNAYLAETIAHEMGHFLQLKHSNENCANTNCLIDGDRVCDTEPHKAIGGDLVLCTLASECVPSSPLKWDNVMHSVLTPCMTILTQGQAKRLRYLFQWTNPKLYSFENNQCTGTGSLSTNLVNGEQVVNSSYTYDYSGYPAPIQLNYSIRVKPGAILTIGSGVEIRMCGGSKIIVEPNGKLFLSGKLTNSCDKTWEGIEIYGTSINDNQNYNTNPAIVPFGYKQGYIQCYPGSVIENANTAIKLYGPENKNGGVAICDGLTIRNCKLGVDINEFGLNNATSYRAQFNNCNFITNNDFLFETEDFCGIQMTRVKGIIINSCEFINTKDKKTFPSLIDFGYGIKAVDAGFHVGRACQLGFTPGSCVPERRNKFKGLAYGVFNGKASQGVSASSIKSSNFIGCYYSIHERGSFLQTILFNSFSLGELSHPELVDMQAGIVFEDTYSDMICEENTFTGINGNKTERIGIVADNMGLYSNKFRRNSFSNLKIANLINGFCGDPNHNGLKYLCNTNNNNYGNDFLVPNVTDRITRYQSYDVFDNISTYVNYAAMNTFSHSVLPYGDIENHGLVGINYYYKNVPAQKPEKIYVVMRFDAPEIVDACAVKYCEQPCLAPGKDGLAFHSGTNTTLLKGLYNTTRNQFNDLKIRYPSMSTETKSAFERHLMQLAADVAHYMAYDTIHQTRDSVAVWIAKIDNIKNSSSSFLIGQGNDYQYELLNEEKLTNTEEKDQTSLRQSVIYHLQSLLSDTEKMEKSVFAKNKLTSIGYHYPPDFHIGKDGTGNPELMTKIVAKSFDLYPNPSNGVVNISLGSTLGVTKCTIFDTYGRIVHQSQEKFGSKLITINLGSSITGIFYVELSDDSGSLGVKKFIITR